MLSDLWIITLTMAKDLFPPQEFDLETFTSTNLLLPG